MLLELKGIERQFQTGCALLTKKINIFKEGRALLPIPFAGSLLFALF